MHESIDASTLEEGSELDSLTARPGPTSTVASGSRASNSRLSSQISNALATMNVGDGGRHLGHGDVDGASRHVRVMM